MLAQDGDGMVRGTENFLEGPATADGTAASPLQGPEFDKSNSDHALPSPLGETSFSGEGNGIDGCDATPLQNFGNRLDALLINNSLACYIVGEFGGEFFVRLLRSPQPTLAGHGRTITEALSSLLDCAQAEQTAIGLAKAGEF